jgi:hypothetical protein
MLAVCLETDIRIDVASAIAARASRGAAKAGKKKKKAGLF